VKNDTTDLQLASIGSHGSLLELLQPLLAGSNPLILVFLKAVISLVLGYRTVGFSGVGNSHTENLTLTELEKLFSVDNKQEIAARISEWTKSIEESKTIQERSYKVGYLRGLKEGVQVALPLVEAPPSHKQDTL